MSVWSSYPSVLSLHPDLLGRSPLRVLVVDDLADAADSLAALVDAWGFEVAVARSGRQALTVAAAYRPDVALVDLAMPGMDGYELARRLHDQDVGGRLTLVAVTGFADDSHRSLSQAAGFSFYLVKPTSPDRVRSLLTTLARETGRK